MTKYSYRQQSGCISNRTLCEWNQAQNSKFFTSVLIYFSVRCKLIFGGRIQIVIMVEEEIIGRNTGRLLGFEELFYFLISWRCLTWVCSFKKYFFSSTFMIDLYPFLNLLHVNKCLKTTRFFLKRCFKKVLEQAKGKLLIKNENA